MGHSSIKVTLDLYGNLFPEMIAPVAAALDRLVQPAGPEDASRYAAIPGQWTDGAPAVIRRNSSIRATGATDSNPRLPA